jgi:hypothetical protein
MKRPLVAVASVDAAGLLLAEVFQRPLAALFAVSFLVLSLCFLLKKFRNVLVCLLLALTGWTNLIVHTAVIYPDDLRALIGNEAQIATVRGTLIETPKLKISERGGEPAEHSLAQVRISELRRAENWQPAVGSIAVTTPSVFTAQTF